MPTIPPPELAFQAHVARYLVERHGYGELRQDEIEPEQVIAADHLWGFLQDTQPEALARLEREYGDDTRGEVFRALGAALRRGPLWLTMRQGLTVRGVELQLYYPRPRSSTSAAVALVAKNRWHVRPHFYFGSRNEEIDLLLFLNGLPIVAVELKHERNQTVDDAVRQFVRRDHGHKVFSHPFLYVAADTSEVKVATDPRRADNFRWHNVGLRNEPRTAGEYPIEHLYRDSLSPDGLLEALSFFLVYVPERPADADRPARPAYTIYPRYHQSRLVRGVTAAVSAHFEAHANVGNKFLAHHSAGSGKTLSICWLAERLHSLYRAGTDTRLLDTVFILTDRRSLDTNVRDDLANFRHLGDKVGIARRAEDLPTFLRERKPIVVTTQQKFAWIQSKLQGDPKLRALRVAFLIDEAHRSQEGRMGQAIRVPFRGAEEPDADAPELDEEPDALSGILRETDPNQLFVAFTATPSPATLALFGRPFDTYSEAEAIREGYIVDVAESILSYATLYNLRSPVVTPVLDARLYPPGVVAKALRTVAYQDEGLIHFKAEVMLRIFEESIRPLIDGQAKAMIVASSRVAGLRYFEVLRDKLRERGSTDKVLYAFSDFEHPETERTVTEHEVNGLAPGELIEDRFEGPEYRLLVVASKFQTGFDQPLLAGMFLDKSVSGRNAVQTVSRLNRCARGKQKVVVVDFTNNAREILQAFAHYRTGSPPPADEPDPAALMDLLTRILADDVFTLADAQRMETLFDATDALRQAEVARLRARLETALPTVAQRRDYVNQLARYVRTYHYLTSFFTFPDDAGAFARFGAYVGPQLLRDGNESELMRQARALVVTRAAVTFVGEVLRTPTTPAGGSQGEEPGGGIAGRTASNPPPKVTIQEVIDDLRIKFPIADGAALFIREVIEEKGRDPNIRSMVVANRGKPGWLLGTLRDHVKTEIRAVYRAGGRFDELVDPRYTDAGGIFDSMASAVIELHLSADAAEPA